MYLTLPSALDFLENGFKEKYPHDGIDVWKDARGDIQIRLESADIKGLSFMYFCIAIKNKWIDRCQSDLVVNGLPKCASQAVVKCF